MDKKKILIQIISDLDSTLAAVKAAALQAKEAATNEESKAENEYDTRGLEASYLAGAQAKRADQLLSEITQLKELSLKSFNDDSEISATALVEVIVDADVEQFLFILPVGGGNKVVVGNKTIHIVTPSSPIGKMMIGQKVGSSFEFSVGEKTKEYEILSVI